MSSRKSKTNKSPHLSGTSDAPKKDKFGMDPNFCGDQHADTFQSLSESDYSKVIFCDLYYNNDSTVGCRFQITDHVHEDPCDYIGLFRVGFVNLSQRLATKLLSNCDCEEDGKQIRCTFKPSELPVLENGFYQFIYVTRDGEICGASMPFQINSDIISKELDDDIVADSSGEDDFLVVRSTLSEKNRRLQALLDEMTEKCLNHEGAMKRVQLELKQATAEKIKLEHSLKQACAEKLHLLKESQRITEEKEVVCSEKEEAIRILKEKNKVFSSMFDNYSEKLREFTDLKDALEADKNLVISENVKLQDRIEQLNKEIQNERKVLELEREKNKNLIINMKKDQIALSSELDDSKLMIEVLEKSKKLSMDELSSLTEEIAKLKSKLKDKMKENLILQTQLNRAQIDLDKAKKEEQKWLSEVAALKFHIIDNYEPDRQIMDNNGPDKPETLRRRAHKSDGKEKKEASVPPEVKENDKKQAASSSEVKENDKKQTTSSSEVKENDKKQASSSSEVKENDKRQESSSSEVKKSDKKQASSSSGVKENHKKQASSSTEVKGKKSSVRTLQEENIQTDETNADIEKYKHHCDELHVEIEKKNLTIMKLQEELLKTRGVVEYLTKERDSAQKNENQKQQALDECILRLNEAAELYKKQFRKIEKLKKKLSKNNTDYMESSSVTMSLKDPCSAAESGDEASSTTSKLTQAHNSDSDTGEHVLRHPTEENVVSAMKGLVQKRVISYYSPQEMQPSSSKNREVPELQTLIEMNLEKFKNSKSKEEEDVLYAIPCPVCDQDVGVFMSSTDEMIKHLEMQHKQQICPVCGRLFDMTLPPKYFMFHVDDHFNKRDK